MTVLCYFFQDVTFVYIHFAVKDAHIIHTCGLRRDNAYRSVCICETVLESGYRFSSSNIFLGSAFISSSILLNQAKIQT